jgi:transketolase
MPSWELFAAQPQEYRDSVLTPDVARVTVEAGVGMGWQKYAGPNGRVVSLERFGASAPHQVNMDRLGFTAENVAALAEALV